MANEIKFIFTGDTAAFDKAIDSVVKKTNKVKTATEKTTEAQKVQAKLQKLLNEEYNRGAKATGGILKIQKDIKRTEQERVKLSKRLNEASLTREKRLRTIVELSKKEAYFAAE
jgi:seryl-tRNA synthetase